jgi:hypothetical protein
MGQFKWFPGKMRSDIILALVEERLKELRKDQTAELKVSAWYP